MVTLEEISRRCPDAAGCDALYRVHHIDHGLVGFIALHDTSLGVGFGGIRRLPYTSERAAIADVVRLAEQMTMKTALAELPVGGAKGVIIARPGLAAETAYLLMGEAIESLDGAYVTGPDVGTGAAQLAFVRRTTEHVNPPENQPAASTALGVLLACEAALSHLHGGMPASFAAAVQGVGSVGGGVAAGLAARGGELAIADIVPDRVTEALARLPAVTREVRPDEVVAAACELFSPCALGPVITDANISTLRCRVICGGANNQLDDPGLAMVLQDLGILYVPDFAANAGAVIEGVYTQLGAEGEDPSAKIAAAIAAIGPRVAAILAEAEEMGWTPLEVALSRTER